MAKFDVESFLDGIVDRLKADLNTKIGSINTEKSDSLTLKTVDNDAYFLQELNGKQANWNPFIIVGFEPDGSSSQGPHTVQNMVVTVAICISDSGEDVAIGRRMLRYSRALREVLESNWSYPGLLKCQVSSLAPIDFRFLDSSELYRAVGVEIKASIG